MPHPPKPPAPTDPRATTLQRIRNLSYLLDNAIPIPGIGRIGIDPLLGLIPGGGDTVGGLLSAYIIWESAQLGIPRSALLQMAWNVVLETLVGTVPFLGDLFDATWKANARNLALLERLVDLRSSRRKTDWLFLTLLIGALLLIVIGFATVSVLVARFVIGALFGQ